MMWILFILGVFVYAFSDHQTFGIILMASGFALVILLKLFIFFLDNTVIGRWINQISWKRSQRKRAKERIRVTAARGERRK